LLPILLELLLNIFSIFSPVFNHFLLFLYEINRSIITSGIDKYGLANTNNAKNIPTTPQKKISVTQPLPLK